MGKKAGEIIEPGLDRNWLIDQLNRALADEWLAYYQYWAGSKVVRGMMRDAVEAELAAHAAEEYAHAEVLADRIIQLGGRPLLTPKAWMEKSNAEFLEPTNPCSRAIVEQNLRGERGAIEVYNRLLESTGEDDPVTYDMVLKILADEIGHEEDLQKFVEDFEMIRANTMLA